MNWIVRFQSLGEVLGMLNLPPEEKLDRVLYVLSYTDDRDDFVEIGEIQAYKGGKTAFTEMPMQSKMNPWMILRDH